MASGAVVAFAFGVAAGKGSATVCDDRKSVVCSQARLEEEESEDAVRAAALLGGELNPYGDMVVDPDDLPMSVDAFSARLSFSVACWRAEGVRGVWMKVPVAKSHLLTAAIGLGFDYHHAERTHCMMTCWLPDSPSPLPPNASNQVGVGALCVNEEGKVLLVQEKSGPFSRGDIWKIPTGLLDAHEDMKDGVERELFEETGVRGKFEKLLGFRHAHNAPWGKSDLFFVCLVRVAQAGDFTLQRNEIRSAKWADFREFLDQAPYPRDIPVWSKLYNGCVGPDGIVGNVDGIRMASCALTVDDTSRREYVFY